MDALKNHGRDETSHGDKYDYFWRPSLTQKLAECRMFERQARASAWRRNLAVLAVIALGLVIAFFLRR